ncbi:UDP-3-O-(3-hydroxymyristoyl)glucosamine N-acyltransferase [Spongorhabdus nitratireducens]
MKQPEFLLSELAQLLGTELHGNGDLKIKGLATLQNAQADQLGFLANPAYKGHLETTKAGAVILSPAVAGEFSGNALVAPNPYLAYAKASHLFDAYAGFEPGIHPSAVIDEQASVDALASIGPNVVIEAGASIAAGVRIDAGCVVGRDSRIGADSRLCANVTVTHGIVIGERVYINSGAVIGSDGFGHANEKGHWHKIAQIGGVVIEDDVEIGSNTTIDRGALDDTVIKQGARLDNLIQIAHNVVIGEHTAIAGCVGISGSTRIGKHCTIAGGAGLVGHIEVADGSHISGMTMVTKSITEPGSYSSGTGAHMPTRDWKRQVVRLRQLDDMSSRVKQLEKQLAELKSEE